MLSSALQQMDILYHAMISNECRILCFFHSKATRSTKEKYERERKWKNGIVMSRLWVFNEPALFKYHHHISYNHRQGERKINIIIIIAVARHRRLPRQSKHENYMIHFRIVVIALHVKRPKQARARKPVSMHGEWEHKILILYVSNDVLKDIKWIGSVAPMETTLFELCLYSPSLSLSLFYSP